MSVTGLDYRKSDRTDMATVVGMRLAMFEAVQKWRGLDRGYQTVDKAISLISDSCYSSAILKAAGTHNIVAGYYADLLTKAGPENVVDFLYTIPAKAISWAKKAIEKPESKRAYFYLAGASYYFSKGLKKFLGRNTVTHSFLHYVKNNQQPWMQDELHATPLEDPDILLIKKFEPLARLVDRLTPNSVGHLWVTFRPEHECASYGSEKLLSFRLGMDIKKEAVIASKVFVPLPEYSTHHAMFIRSERPGRAR